MKQFITSHSMHSVSIMCIEEGQSISIGCIDASDFSFHGEGVWYLNRLFIRDKYRKQGIGSQLIIRLKKEFISRIEQYSQWPQCTRLIVEPGGYNSDPEDLAHFYKKQGFYLSEDPNAYILEVSQ